MPPKRNAAQSTTPISTSGSNDYSIYPHMDGIRPSAPWRLADYDDRGALSDAVLSKLAQRFDLTEQILRQLSIEVGNSLDTGSHLVLVAVSRDRAIKRAETSLKVALRWANHETGSAHIREALLPLEAAFAQDATQAAVLCTAKDHSNDDDCSMADLVAAVQRVLHTPGCAADMSPCDKRRVWDKRREYVVQSCCYAWQDAGHPITYTTVSDGSKRDQRHGPLIDLIQMVVGMVTNPSSHLSGETIRKDIDRFKAHLKDPDGIRGEPDSG